MSASKDPNPTPAMTPAQHLRQAEGMPAVRWRWGGTVGRDRRMSDGVMGDRMREVGREYHAILTLQWRAFPSGFHITTVESTLTFGSAVTRRDVFEDMQGRAVAAAAESGCSAAKTGSGSVLFFTCEPNTL